MIKIPFLGRGGENIERISIEGEKKKIKKQIEKNVAEKDRPILYEIFAIIEQLTDNPHHQIELLSKLHSIVIIYGDGWELESFKKELLELQERRKFLGRLRDAFIALLVGAGLGGYFGYEAGRRKQETPKLETTPTPPSSPTETPPLSQAPTPLPTETPTTTLSPTPTKTSTPEATPTPDFKTLEEEVISKYFPTLKQILELPENKGAYVDWGSVEEYSIASEENGVLFKVYGLRKIPCGIFGECSDYGNGKILTLPKPFNKENRFSNREWLQSFPGYGGSRAYIKGKEIVVEDTDKFIILYYAFESKFSDRQVEALTEEEIKEFLNKIKELAKLQNAK